MNKQEGLVAAWYVPTPTMGGGGFRTILQNASALSCRGYRNDFYVIPPVNKVLDLLFVEESCLAWFGMAPDRWLLAGANEEDRTLSIATSWTLSSIWLRVHMALLAFISFRIMSLGSSPWIATFLLRKTRIATGFELSPLASGSREK